MDYNTKCPVNNFSTFCATREKKSTRVGAFKILKYRSTAHSYEKNMIFIYEPSTSFYQASAVVNVVGHQGNWPAILVLQPSCLLVGANTKGYIKFC